MSFGFKQFLWIILAFVPLVLVVSISTFTYYDLAEYLFIPSLIFALLVIIFRLRKKKEGSSQEEMIQNYPPSESIATHKPSFKTVTTYVILFVIFCLAIVFLGALINIFVSYIVFGILLILAILTKKKVVANFDMAVTHRIRSMLNICKILYVLMMIYYPFRFFVYSYVGDTSILAFMGNIVGMLYFLPVIMLVVALSSLVTVLAIIIFRMNNNALILEKLLKIKTILLLFLVLLYLYMVEFIFGVLFPFFESLSNNQREIGLFDLFFVSGF